MTKIGLIGLLTLASTAAFAGEVYDIPINGGVARIRINEKCRDALCGSVSWSERGARREHREFRIPGISSKTIAKLIGGHGGWGSGGPDDDAATGNPAAPGKSRRGTEGKNKAMPLSAPPDQQEPSAQPAQTSNPADPPAPPAASAPPALAMPAPSAAPALSAAVAPAEPGAAPAPASAIPDESAVASAPPASAMSSEPAAAPAPGKAAVADPAAPASAKLATVAPPAPRTPSSSRSPVGEWLVENGEGQIRIEECGANLCGYISVAKNPNEKDRKNPDPALRGRSVIGTPVLIDMKRSGNRWNGRVYNVKDGKSYTAHISLKGADTLRVEGCAFGGLVCGGQDWSRVN